MLRSALWACREDKGCYIIQGTWPFKCCTRVGFYSALICSCFDLSRLVFFLASCAFVRLILCSEMCHKETCHAAVCPHGVVVLWIHNWVVLSWWVRRHRVTCCSHLTPRRSEGVRPQGGLPAQTTGLKQCQKTLSRRRRLLKSATSSWCSCCQRIHSSERVRSFTHIIYILKKGEGDW